MMFFLDKMYHGSLTIPNVFYNSKLGKCVSRWKEELSKKIIVFNYFKSFKNITEDRPKYSHYFDLSYAEILVRNMFDNMPLSVYSFKLKIEEFYSSHIWSVYLFHIIARNVRNLHWNLITCRFGALK